MQTTFEGTDLNRTWDTASPHAHPTVHTIRDVIDKLSKTVFTSFADDSKYFLMQTPSRKTLSTLFWTSMSPTHYLASLLLAMPMTASFGGILTLYWGKNILSFLFSRNERHIVFPKMLAQNCRDFSNTNTMYNKVYRILLTM